MCISTTLSRVYVFHLSKTKRNTSQWWPNIFSFLIFDLFDHAYTVWKFHDFSAAQILREINFDHFKAPKSVILTILGALSYQMLGVCHIFKCEIPKNQKFKAWKLISRKKLIGWKIALTVSIVKKILWNHFYIDKSNCKLISRIF